jgi:DNA mismatch endonuclease (patch repair protein)
MPLTTTERMKRVRQAHTAPELAVRSILRELGVRYRTCVDDLPGKPDIANKSAGWAIFVHGCFWHGHPGCVLFTRPKTNRMFWEEKVRANRARDRRKERALLALGFRVATIWQCELRDHARLSKRLATFFRLHVRNAA